MTPYGEGAVSLDPRDIADSTSVLGTYAAPEWDELHEDGQQWVRALVAETLRRAALSHPRPSPPGPDAGELREALEAERMAAKAAHEFVARVTDRKGVDGWTLQGSIYEGFTTEIWADGAEAGKRTIAIVRDYQDALKIMAALRTPEEGDSRG